ncbi:MAG: FitA-like ribbon-helix-helix domain-containing protein [Egibacteraceae bacterium]
MKQLIARIDDHLHRQLKERAAAEGRSLNAVVTDALRAAVAQVDARTALRARLRVEGRLVEPPPGPLAPSRGVVLEATRGSGPALSQALDHDRATR